MSPYFVDPATAAALSLVIKASVLLAVAGIGEALLWRRASAAVRHLLWTLACIGLLLLPLLALAVPDWPIVWRTGRAVAPAAAPVLTDRPEATAAFTPPAAPTAAQAGAESAAPADVVDAGWHALAIVYAGGVLMALLPLAAAWWNARRLVREASEIHDPDWIRLFDEGAGCVGVQRSVRRLRSRECRMPMAVSTWRPAVLIPAIADTWTEDRRRAVVLHELAHIARYDCLTQSLALAACAVYWFHPGVWWVARRLRIERELACDDRVIAAGTPARAYAGHLLEIAYASGHQRAVALAVSMARPHQLERRMLAVLDVARDRRLTTVRLRAGSAAAGLVLLCALAAARPSVVAAEGELAVVSIGPAGVRVEIDDARQSGRPPVADESRPASTFVAGSATAASVVAQDDLPGTWEIRQASAAGSVHLRLIERNSSSGSNVPLDRLEGLSATQLSGAGGPVEFRLRRDAGTFTFEGIIRNGVGAGTFSFAADAQFPAELVKRGFARPTAREQYQLARHDIGYAFLDELNQQGYARPETSELVRAGQHGVDATYLREMAALGHRLGSLAPLITLRDHGVTPDYVRELAEHGYKGLSADQLRGARDHGITPEYVQGMRDAGYASLPMEELITARDHGVTPQFVSELAAAGYRGLPLDQVRRVRDHGVSPEYARELRQLGHQLSLDELVRARDHGVSLDYARGMRDAGFGSLSMDQLVKARDHGVSLAYVGGMAALGYGSSPLESLIRIRDHGVTTEYVQQLKALGYDGLPLEDLVALRDRGLTPDRIRSANGKAGTRLPVDLLLSLAGGDR